MHIRTSDQTALDLGFGDYTCNWGAHMCGLYETAEERDRILIGFLASGIQAGDLGLYCPVERTVEDFWQTLAREFPEAMAKAKNTDVPALELKSARELYYPDGVFSPQAMDVGLEAFFAQSQRRGPRNVRGTAEMVWALEAVPGREHLMVYESRLNYFIPGKPWISICLYNLTKFGGATIMDVLRTHPYVISKGVITENPYYQNPDDWLRANAPQFLPKR
jgi:hypothetical protein